MTDSLLSFAIPLYSSIISLAPGSGCNGGIALPSVVARGGSVIKIMNELCYFAFSTSVRFLCTGYNQPFRHDRVMEGTGNGLPCAAYCH